MTRIFKESNALFDRASRSIPLASQTFSKSVALYPREVSPLFIERGHGCHVWDVDGNEFVDFVSGLLCITLGYNYPEVTAAVEKQLQDGTIFSLPHRLEMEVAEKLIQLIPCAEMVRFGKNGSDATAGAVRLARAYTGRDHVAVCGYHGWQDWYIGSTSRRAGVPEATQALTHTFRYNDIESLRELFEKNRNRIAAVVMEPMNTTFPEEGFLASVKDLAHEHGALLIFDEIITGFRYSLGGAQSVFGVTPDLATFGKGMANGFPISAVVGRAEIMRVMEEIFFSFTFGGETLSLAASLAVIEVMEREQVLTTISKRGAYLRDGLTERIRRLRADEYFEVSGHPSWTFLQFKEAPRVKTWESKALYMQEMIERGYLLFGTHNLNYSHGEQEIDGLLSCYDEVLPLLRDAIAEGRVAELLRAEAVPPIFSVR